jgi:hypothetical protein
VKAFNAPLLARLERCAQVQVCSDVALLAEAATPGALS